MACSKPKWSEYGYAQCKYPTTSSNQQWRSCSGTNRRLTMQRIRSLDDSFLDAGTLAFSWPRVYVHKSDQSEERTERHRDPWKSALSEGAETRISRLQIKDEPIRAYKGLEKKCTDHSKRLTRLGRHYP